MIDNYVIHDFSKILKTNHQKMRQTLGKSTNVMRVYDRNLDVLKLTVDIYALYAVICDYSENGLEGETLEKVCSAASSSLFKARSNIIYKHRKKGDEYKTEAEPVNIKIKEDDAVYNVELTQKMDTGFYLDNYNARLLVKELSFGRKVLNMFCYTASYSVQAARGGATSVVSVDTSASALDIARKNMEDNNFKGDMFEYYKKDVFEFLAEYNGSKFDIIIIDAPSFSNAHSGRRESFDIQKDHVRLITAAKAHLAKEGVIILRTAYSKFKLDVQNLSDFKVFNYTAELLAPGFTKKSTKVFSYVLKSYNAKKFYINKKKV